MTQNVTLISILALTLSSLTACVSATPTDVETAKTPGRMVEPKAASTEDTSGYVLSALETQTLEIGECGLFLFTERPSPRFVFFGSATRGVGKIRHYGQAVALELVDGEGDIFDQTYAVQKLRSLDGKLLIDLSIDSVEPGEGGSRVSSGSLRLTDSEGWVTVTPVAGATACRSS